MPFWSSPSSSGPDRQIPPALYARRGRSVHFLQLTIATLIGGPVHSAHADEPSESPSSEGAAKEEETPAADAEAVTPTTDSNAPTDSQNESSTAASDAEDAPPMDAAEAAPPTAAESPAPTQTSGHETEPGDGDGLSSEPIPPWVTRLVPEVHGFVSQGFIKSTDNNYLANSEDGSFEISEVGLNFTTRITDELRVGMQLFMRDLGPIGNYKPQFDWFYLDYRFFDWFGIRAGRTKIPFGLYNEVNDTPSARLPILLPQSLYPATARDFLLAQTGIELYGIVPLGVLGELEYRAYGGTIYIPSSDALPEIEVPYVVGGRLMWQTPIEGLVAGGTVQDAKLNGTIALTPEQLQAYIDQGILPAGSGSLVPISAPIFMWVGSVQYSYRSLLLAAEYSRWISKYSVLDPPLTSPETQAERLYGMAAWQWNPWLQTGAYYSLFYPDANKRSQPEDQQHDVAFTVRFDFNEHFLLKLEGHYMHGTAALDPALNDGVERADLVDDWGVFLAKTTAYF